MAKAKTSAAAKKAAARKAVTARVAKDPNTSIADTSNTSFDQSVADTSVVSSSCRSEDDGARTPTGTSRSPDNTLLEDDDDDFGDEPQSGGPSNVVVCVRVRPAPTNASSDADSAEPWKLMDSDATIEATEQHPSLAKRGSSSAPSYLASSASSTYLSDAAKGTGGSNSESDTYKFTFDSILPPTSNSLHSLYSSHISPVVTGAVQGYNGTVFAYGQTGSGKTYTMSGGGGDRGVIGRAIDEVFQSVAKDTSREFLLRVSYLEIYNESLKDLLVNLPSSASSSTNASASRPASPIKGGFSHQSAGGSTLRIQEHPASGRVTISGLREEVVTCPADVLSLLERGQAARHQAATDWNERSSRSHCVATITIESRMQEGGDGVRVSALNLIDLAGSERAASEKERRKEGSFINKSLLTLGSVISKLSSAASNPSSAQHIPYRDSKLTRLLQTSLSGNARVAVLLTMSPLSQHAVEGLSTLKFGRRCKMIKLQARRGEVKDGDGGNEALLRRYRREVERLRAKLDETPSAVVSRPIEGAENDAALKDLQSLRREAESEVADMTKQKAQLRAQMEHLTKLILTGKSVAETEQGSRPGTPNRQRGRMSEFGTPGTPTKLPSKPGSPAKKRMFGTPLRATSVSLNVADESSEDDVRGGSDGKAFVKEAELASLRRSLATALEGKGRAERALAEETKRLQSQTATLKGELEENQRRNESAREQQVKELKRMRDEAKGLLSERAELRDELESSRNELASKTTELEEAQKKLSKRPETDEEKVQTEFDELVKQAREKEDKMAKSPRLTPQPALSPRPHSRNISPSREQEVRRREQAVSDREAKLQRAEADFAKKQQQQQQSATAARTADCQHAQEIESLNKQLEEARRNQKPAPPSPQSPSKLRDTLSASPANTRSPTNALLRGGSVREYKRYLPSLSPGESSGSPSASASSSSHSTTLLEKALRDEQDEVARLNEVIQGQRTVMSVLESSVSEWQRKMVAQQDIIRRLMEGEAGEEEAGGSRQVNGGKTSSPMPRSPLSSLAPATSSRSSDARPLPQPPAKDSTPLLNGQARAGSAQASDDFLKRRSAFQVGSNDSKSSNLGGSLGAKQRGGSAMPSLGSSASTTGTSPYYGAHIYNRAPANPGLGVTAPSSPTKGSGLWGMSLPQGATGPGALPMPAAASSSINGSHAEGGHSSSSTQRRRRPTIENELASLKNGASPKVDERTRGLLDSPKREGGAASSCSSGSRASIPSVGKGEKASKDWYI